MQTTGVIKVTELTIKRWEAELSELHELVFAQYHAKSPDYRQLSKTWARIDALEEKVAQHAVQP